MSASLEIKDLHVSVGGKEIIQGITLTIKAGEKHALMGPNGSGKSTLSNSLMGHPAYMILSGDIVLNGESILKMPADERSRKGLFLAFQYPVAIPGVSVANFLRSAIKARVPSGVKDGDSEAMRNFRKTLKTTMEALEIDPGFATRYLNDGFSGGEKKRLEILQMAMLAPSIAILDETDSGLDIDALRVVSDGINRACGPETGVLLITHYQRLLNYVKPDFVHVLMHGKIVKSGGPELALKLESGGYDPLAAELAAGG